MSGFAPPHGSSADEKWYAQTMRLTCPAAQLYLAASHVAFAQGVLSWNQYLLRLLFVRDSADRETIEWDSADHILQGYEIEKEDEWPEGEPDSHSGESPTCSEVAIVDNHRPFEPPVLHFIGGAATGLQHWRFHQADADFFPSIPHGHWHSDNRKKLDAYRDWFYQFDRQVGREPRWKIIALWNDDKFRSFAVVAIQHYIVAFRAYRWPVPYPSKLPRRRRTHASRLSGR